MVLKVENKLIAPIFTSGVLSPLDYRPICLVL